MNNKLLKILENNLKMSKIDQLSIERIQMQNKN